MSEQVETIVVPKAAVKPKRSFAGFDADLSVDLPELSVRVPVKYEKISSKAVREKLKILHRAEAFVKEGEGYKKNMVEVSNKPSPYRGTVRLDADPQVRGNPQGVGVANRMPSALILA